MTERGRTVYKLQTVAKSHTVKRAARGRERRPGRSEVFRVRLSPKEITTLRGMARRADLTDAAFVRSMIGVHSKMEHELLRQRAERAAEEQRKLIEAADRDDDAQKRRAQSELVSPPLARVA